MQAEARCGVIPVAAAAEIAASCNVETLDFDLLRYETEIVGYPILPLVHQISKQCGKAGGYVHWGATTQDIMDTAVVLQIRDALDIVQSDVDQLRVILRQLAQRYRDTPMAGRTHLQQALPITFSYKVAIWLSMFDRHAERLAQMRSRVLVGEFAGAAGTLAFLGDKGLAVQAALMDELKLGVPAATWHVARDGLAEAVNLLGLITGSLGKIDYDVMLLAAAKGVRQHAGLMLDAMVQDLERATGFWHAEWIAIPEAFILSAGAFRWQQPGHCVRLGNQRSDHGAGDAIRDGTVGRHRLPRSRARSRLRWVPASARQARRSAIF